VCDRKYGRGTTSHLLLDGPPGPIWQMTRRVPGRMIQADRGA
jgi:hypothetical protein